MMVIDAYREGFEDDLWQVFYTAIRQGCVDHYSPAQLDAWAPYDFDRQVFSDAIRDLTPYIASIDQKIVGYADLQSDGYIDHFYVHGEHQKKGVGSALMVRIMKDGKNFPRIYANVSNTAKPFFEKHGFCITRRQLIEIRGQHLQNNAMELRKGT